MFDSLLKYKHTGVFSFSPTERLQDKCNAPKTCQVFISLSKARNLYTLDAVEECLPMVQYAIVKVAYMTDWSMDISLRKKQGSIPGH